MILRFLIGFYCLFLIIPASHAVLPDSAAQNLLPLDGTWQFQWQQVLEPSLDTVFDQIEPATGAWETISVPGHWESAGYQPTDLGLISAGVGIYRRSFTLPMDWQGKRIFLQIEGALDAYRVSVDGLVAGENRSGTIPAQYDVTESLHNRAEHEIQIVVAKIQDDKAEINYSGLYRNVYLFAVGHAAVEDAVVGTVVKDSAESATLNATLHLRKFRPEWNWNEFTISVQLNEPDSEPHAQMEVTYLEAREDRAVARVSLPVRNPRLWSAEQPILYSLNLKLRREDATLHWVERAVGLRQIDTLKNSLYLNQKPITLRGVGYFEYHPKLGMALTSEQWQQDLSLMKQAHIDTVRIVGLPPHPAFLSLCDRLGIYVLCDYPVARMIASNVKEPTADTSWTRRFGLHPSLIAWNLPLQNSPQDQLSFSELKQSDPSHPIIGIIQPGTASSIQPDALAFPSVIVSSQDNLKGIEKPMLAYLQNPLVLADFWPRVHREANWFGAVAGLFIAPSEKAVGMVSGEREPGLLYWNTKRIYAPVQIEEETVRVKPGRQVVELNIHNGYSYTHLKEVATRWKLLRDTETVQEEEMLLSLPPGQSMRAAFPIQLPEDFSRHEYHLALNFIDPNTKAEMNHSVWLQPADWQRQLVMKLNDLKFDPDFKVDTSIADTDIQHAYFSFHTQSATGEWFVSARERNIRLITEGPFIRLGWEDEPITLYSDFWMEKRNVEQEGNAVEVQSLMMALVPNATEAPFYTQMDLLGSGFGYVDVRCSIVPPEEPKPIRELGVGFVIPSTLSKLSWVGQGPYPSYPELERLTWRGIFNLDLRSAYSPGNRRKINMAMFTDERGSGIGIVALEGNVGWEPHTKGTLVFVNALTSHPWAKGAIPSTRTMDTDGPPVVFRLVPWGPGQMPEAFRQVMGGD